MPHCAAAHDVDLRHVVGGQRVEDLALEREQPQPLSGARTVGDAQLGLRPLGRTAPRGREERRDRHQNGVHQAAMVPAGHDSGAHDGHAQG